MDILPISARLALSDSEREAYNALAANLALTKPEGGIIAFTSCRSDAGRASALLGLALSLAGAGHSVLMIDGDLRNRRLSTLCGAESAEGLSSCLAGKASPEAVLSASDLQGLSLVPAGPAVSDPTALLSSDALSRLLLRLGEHTEFVLIDSPAVLPTADGSLLAAAADSSILYVEAERVSRRDLLAAKQQLEKSGHPTVGTVVGEAAGKRRIPLLSRLPFLGKKS